MAVTKKDLVLVAIFAGTALLLSLAILFISHHKSYPKPPAAWRKTPATLPLGTIQTATNGATMKFISFPAYNLSLQIPTNFETLKEIDASAEGTQIGSNSMTFYSPDTEIKRHMPTAGVQLSIVLSTDKQSLTPLTMIVPSPSIDKATLSASLLPKDSALLSDQNTQTFSFLAVNNKAWTVTTEVLLRNGGNMLDVNFYCNDYSVEKNSPACIKLMKEILPTLQKQ